MPDDTPADELSTLLDTDPRLDPDYVRRLSDGANDVVLVGVVHDHPASVYRVRTIADTLDPDTLALELPPLALPLFSIYAADGRTPPAFGGEMSAAIQATDARPVGIDAPNRTFLGALARRLRADRPSLDTLRRVVTGLGSVSRHAAVCRAAASLARRTSLRIEVDSPVDHDCASTDPPAEQARDERRHVATSVSLLRAARTPHPVQLRDETREDCMAHRLRSLRQDGSVVAVVGLDHLDAVATRMTDP